MPNTDHPLARTTALKVQSIADETLVYDDTTDKAYGAICTKLGEAMIGCYDAESCIV